MRHIKTEACSPVEPYGREHSAPIIFMCEHASLCVPAEFEFLRLDEKVLQSHVAGDSGAIGVQAARIIRKITQINGPQKGALRPVSGQ